MGAAVVSCVELMATSMSIDCMERVCSDAGAATSGDDLSRTGGSERNVEGGGFRLCVTERDRGAHEKVIPVMKSIGFVSFAGEIRIVGNVNSEAYENRNRDVPP